MFYWKFLNLPEPPEYLKQQALAVVDQPDPGPITNPHIQYAHGRSLYQNGQAHGRSSGFGIRTVSVELEDWIEQNIVPTRRVGVGSTVPGLDHVGPHRDQSRDYSLLYLLRSGGQNATTKFWELKTPAPLEYYYSNYDDLIQVDQVTAPVGQWYILNAKMIHSVENVVEGRVSIQVGLMSDQVPKAWLE